ncbi:MAG: exonuclease SbcCD subunit D [Fusobacteriota bacterium]
MKIIHTGDWHIGKLVHGLHMTKDQEYILDQFIDILKKEKPDLIIIAGDIYDRSIPPVEAIRLLNKTFSKILIDLKIPIIGISGNHDSSDRIEFVSEILEKNNLYLKGNLENKITPIILEDKFGKINFYPIPYTEPAVIKEKYNEPDIKNHDDAMKVVLENINLNKNERNICIAHSFITGTDSIEVSDSVRPLSIGGTDYVSVDYFKDFDYVALGHLHRPQKVKVNKIRYSGSIMKYSFSEATQHKSITIVNINKKGDISYKTKELIPKRNMRKIQGKLENLIDPEVYKSTNTDDYIMAVLTDKGALRDPISKLRPIYPNILKLERKIYNREVGQDKTSAQEGFEEKNSLELFEEFYENISGSKFSEKKKEIVSDIINKINTEGRNI